MSRFAFIDREKALYPVSLLCSLLKVSRSGFYAWARRPPSKRAVADAVLTEQIAGFHEASRRTYGAPRIHLDLAEAGIHVGRKRVARLMRAAGLEGVHRRAWRHGTKQNPAAVPAPDLLERDFTATGVRSAASHRWLTRIWRPLRPSWQHDRHKSRVHRTGSAPNGLRARRNASADVVDSPERRLFYVAAHRLPLRLQTASTRLTSRSVSDASNARPGVLPSYRSFRRLTSVGPTLRKIWL